MVVVCDITSNSVSGMTIFVYIMCVWLSTVELLSNYNSIEAQWLKGNFRNPNSLYKISLINDSSDF